MEYCGIHDVLSASSPRRSDYHGNAAQGRPLIDHDQNPLGRRRGRTVRVHN